jgi:hypothetical protein
VADLSNTQVQVASTGEVLTAPAILNRQLSLLKFIPTSLWAAILDGTSTTSVSTYIQEALDEAEARGGAEILVEEGTYRITKTLLVPSNTVLRGKGAKSIIKTLTGSWSVATTRGGYEYCMFINKNYSAASLTDTDIGLHGVTLDNQNLNGAGHGWLMRMVTRPWVRDSIIKNAASAVAFLATKDSLIEGSYAENLSNCGFDHWDGFLNAKVIGCTVRGANDQGIQFTATGTAYEDRTSNTALVMGCSVYNVVNSNRATPYSSAIIANCVDTGSSNFYMLSIGNYIETCDNGIVFGGGGGWHQSINDTIKLATEAPFLVQDEGSSRVPAACVIDGLTLINCDHASANIALIAIGGGARHTIRNVKIENPGSLSWDYQLWLASGTSSCTVDPIVGPAGGTGRILNSGTSNTVNAFASPYIVAGSDGSGAYTDLFAPGLTYRARVRDAGSLSFNGSIQASTTLNATTDISLGSSGLIVFGAGSGYWIQKLGADCYWREPSGPSIIKMN